MVRKKYLYEKAVALRNKGFTYGEILEEILKTKNNKYPNGICRITVYDVSVRRKINNLLKLIKAKWAPVAQRIEQHTPKVKVVGSIPTRGTIKI